MIDGKADHLENLDLSTLDFIVSIINETINNYTPDQLESVFGITQ